MAKNNMELRLERLKVATKLAKSLRFGDIVENFWASKDNPTRVGVFVKHSKVSQKKTILLTNMKGKFWNLAIDPGLNVKLHGSIFDWHKVDLQKYITL